MALTTPVSVLDESLNRIMGAPGVAAAPQVAPVSYSSLPTTPGRDIGTTSNVAQAAPQAAAASSYYIAPPAPVAAPTIAAPAAQPVATLSTPTAAPAAAPAASALPWKTYDAYYTGAPALDPFDAKGKQQRAEEYNNYKLSLPLIYQDTINYGFSPEQVASGAITGIARGGGIDKIPTAYDEAMSIYGTQREGWGTPTSYGTPWLSSQQQSPAELGYQPLTAREYAGQIGMTRPAWQATAQPERQRIRGEFQAARAARAATQAPATEAMNRVVGT